MCSGLRCQHAGSQVPPIVRVDSPGKLTDQVGQALVKLTKLYQAGGEFAFREAAPASIRDSLLDATGPSGSGPVSLDGGPSLRGTLLTGESYEGRFAQHAHPRIPSHSKLARLAGTPLSR